MYEIEHDIPLPVGAGRKGNPVFPLGAMEPGDSIFIPDSAKGRAGKIITPGSIAATVSCYGKRHGRKYARRTVDGGIRIWRLS